MAPHPLAKQKPTRTFEKNAEVHATPATVEMSTQAGAPTPHGQARTPIPTSDGNCLRISILCSVVQVAPPYNGT